jgi:hypothetical protein
MKGVSWVNLILGVWVLVSPAVLHISGVLMESNVAIGILAVLVSIWSLLVPARNHAPAWVALVIALWVLISPWALNVPPVAQTLASNALCGAVMTIFAIVRFLSAPVTVTRTPA